MAYRAILDASVLYPFTLRDTLLRLARTELYDCLWSERILEEVTRNIVAKGKADEAGANRLIAEMGRAFEDAEVDPVAVNALEPQMTNDPKDRHVMAAAVAGKANAVITSNLGDFPVAAAEPYSIDITSPDDFLSALYDIDPELVHAALVRQADAMTRPPWSLNDLLDALDRAGAPRFAQALRDDS